MEMFDKIEEVFNLNEDSFGMKSFLSFFLFTVPLMCFPFEIVLSGITWKYSYTNSTILITGMSPRQSEIVVPSEIHGKAVTHLGLFLFDCQDADRMLIRKVVLPDTLISIGPYCFRHCHALTDINLPEGLKVLEDNCFQNCASLVEIELPSSVERVNGSTFWACKSLRRFVFSDNVRFIPGNCFEYDSSLESVVFPRNLEKIGKNSFKDCTAITNEIFYGNPPEGFIKSKLMSNEDLKIKYPYSCRKDWEYVVPPLHFGGYIQE